MAGTMVLLSLALAHWVSPWWLLLTLFVGLNLFQSALTGFCPAEIILKKLGVGGSCCQSDSTTPASQPKRFAAAPVISSAGRT